MREYTTFTDIRDAANNNQIFVLLVKSKNCGVCEAIYERLLSLTEKYGQVVFGFCMSEKVPEFTGQNLIFTVPAVLVFADGKEVERQARFIDFKSLEEAIQSIINSRGK
ncbi:MAG: thioredoxin family protein [Eubacteriaceae bacterium]|nr:thioredoxin family protein [Eubacteriaceae bacterium]